MLTSIQQPHRTAAHLPVATVRFRVLPESDLQHPLVSVSLDDKYTATSGHIYLSGVQALVRLMLVQRWRDAAAGLNTAGFVSGYRGSPLGGLDEALWHAQKQEELGIGPAEVDEIGLRLFKVAMPWPLEPDSVREFADGLDEILVKPERPQLLSHSKNSGFPSERRKNLA